MKTLRIAVIVIIASILFLSVGKETNVFAATNAPGDKAINPKFKYLELPKDGKLSEYSTNNVGIRTAFHYIEGEEVIDSFRSFSTKNTGFDRNRGIVTVELQGTISNDKPLLYQAVDVSYARGTGGSIQHNYIDFDFDVLFTRADQAYRIFSYENCMVKNYNIDTLFDKEETFMGKTKFAYVENIEFECKGLQMWNPTYDQMKADQTAELTADTLAKMKQKSDGFNNAKSKEVAKAQITLQKLQQKTFR